MKIEKNPEKSLLQENNKTEKKKIAKKEIYLLYCPPHVVTALDSFAKTSFLTAGKSKSSRSSSASKSSQSKSGSGSKASSKTSDAVTAAAEAAVAAG